MLIIWIIRKKREICSPASPNKKVVFQFSGKVSYRNCRAIYLTPISGQVEGLTIKQVACKHLEHKLVASIGSHGLTENQFSSVQSLSHVRLFATPWTAARQASLSITNSRSLPKLMSTKSVMPSSHLILCQPLLLLPPIPPSIRVFSNESILCMRWPKYWRSHTKLTKFLFVRELFDWKIREKQLVMRYDSSPSDEGMLTAVSEESLVTSFNVGEMQSPCGLMADWTSSPDVPEPWASGCFAGAPSCKTLSSIPGDILLHQHFTNDSDADPKGHISQVCRKCKARQQHQ